MQPGLHKTNSLRFLNRIIVVLGIFGLGYFVGSQNPSQPLSGPGVQIEKVCFTPHQRCLPLILDVITKAQHEILVQAYSFTSQPIIQALQDAHKRGVKVKILLDKSRYKEVQNSDIKELVYLQKMPGIAHNKIIIVDERIVVTGSYNYTHSAEYRNAENILLIKDPHIVRTYKNNWLRAFEKAKKLLT